MRRADWDPEKVLTETCERLELTEREHAILDAALADDPLLAGDLGYLLAHMQSDPSEVFLRAFVRYVSAATPEPVRGPADALTPALADALASIPPPRYRA
jgi:hypothetical protein